VVEVVQWVHIIEGKLPICMSVPYYQCPMSPGCIPSKPWNIQYVLHYILHVVCLLSMVYVLRSLQTISVELSLLLKAWSKVCSHACHIFVQGHQVGQELFNLSTCHKFICTQECCEGSWNRRILSILLVGARGVQVPWWRRHL
jgi:hypothetical protein